MIYAKKHLKNLFFVALVSGVIFSVFASPVFARISGAIYTTVVDGERVNANIYENKEDVYLNGGPKSENKKSMALPEGWYYFQVTDPPGKKLLSEDPVICRKVYVNDKGVFNAVDENEPCSHSLETDLFRTHLDAMTVQLIPYKDTPNKGGVYKVWITPVNRFEGDPFLQNPSRNRDFVFGFVPAFCKTDNYKVRGRCDPSTIEILKFEDINTNGQWDDGEPEIQDWEITVTDPLGTENGYLTPANLIASKGIWEIEEATDPNWKQTVLFVDGTPKEPATTTASVQIRKDCDETHQVIFGNTRIFDITAVKYHDKNMNGLQDGGEEWTGDLPVITFRLTGNTLAGDPVDIPQSVDADGTAVFEDIVSGNYTLCEEDVPDDWVAVNPESGCITITFPEDADENNELAVSFGNVQKGSIALCKFYDLNRDGEFQTGEEWPGDKPPIEFCLNGTTLVGNDITEQCQTTDENGCVLFADLLPGNYTVCENVPDRWEATTSECATRDLAAGEELDLGNAFGNIDFCPITACKFYDADEDGENNEEQMLEGILFRLFDVDANLELVAERCTGSDGCVTFEKVYFGTTYLLEEVLPVNDDPDIHWVRTTPLEDTIFTLPDECDSVFEFGNICFETGTHAFGTKGYWHNQNGIAELKSNQDLYDAAMDYINSLAPYSTPSGYFDDGDEPFNGQFENGDPVPAGQVNGTPAGSREAEISHFLIESVGNGGIREQLAQQLLAFIFNIHFRSCGLGANVALPGENEVKASDIIDDAVQAWSLGSNTERSAISTLLDSFNNSHTVSCSIVFEVPCEYEPCISD